MIGVKPRGFTSAACLFGIGGVLDMDLGASTVTYVGDGGGRQDLALYPGGCLQYGWWTEGRGRGRRGSSRTAGGSPFADMGLISGGESGDESESIDTINQDGIKVGVTREVEWSKTRKKGSSERRNSNTG